MLEVIGSFRTYLVGIANKRTDVNIYPFHLKGTHLFRFNIEKWPIKTKKVSTFQVEVLYIYCFGEFRASGEGNAP